MGLALPLKFPSRKPTRFTVLLWLYLCLYWFPVNPCTCRAGYSWFILIVRTIIITLIVEENKKKDQIPLFVTGSLKTIILAIHALFVSSTFTSFNVTSSNIDFARRKLFCQKSNQTYIWNSRMQSGRFSMSTDTFANKGSWKIHAHRNVSF